MRAVTRKWGLDARQLLSRLAPGVDPVASLMLSLFHWPFQQKARLKPAHLPLMPISRQDPPGCLV